VNVQSLTVAPPPYIPPPSSAEFPMNVQLVTLGLLGELYIPPPLLVAEFPVNVQLVIVGLLTELYIPPPLEAEPPVIVKPSISVSGPSLWAQVTTDPAPPASIVVSEAPSLPRSAIALPLKSIVSEYVPGATLIWSPSVAAAASMAAWIVALGPCAPFDSRARPSHPSSPASPST